jgi:hypothetical protein
MLCTIVKSNTIHPIHSTPLRHRGVVPARMAGYEAAIVEDIGKRGGTPHYAARYPALIRWRWIDDFLLKSKFSLSFMRTRKTDLSAKQEQDGTCFCHTILEFAAAEKSLALHGGKIGINSSWTGV